MITKQTFMDYLKDGWSVIPIYFQQDNKGKVAKKAMVKWAEYQNRLATEEEVDEWMLKNPTGLALVTGELSRIVAVDVDDKEDPIELTSPIVVKSAFSGGRHYFYRWTEELRNTAKIEGMPVDFRGDGGYIVLPPSYFGDKSYEYVKKADTMYLREVPEDIRKMLESRENQSVSFDLEETGSNVPYPIASDGNRNDTAARVTGSLLKKIDRRLWDVAVWGTLRQWNAENCRPPLPKHELRATYESVKGKELRGENTLSPDEMPKPVSLRETALRRLAERKLEESAPSTGYKELDGYIRGFIPGHVITTTGDTNVGKTTICCNFAHRVSKQGKKVLYFALEPENTIVDYLASIRTGKRFNNLTDDDLMSEDTNIQVYGKESIKKIEDLVAVVNSLSRYDLVIIDHIGYFTSDGNTYERQANVMKQLAGLAKAKQCAILVIAHIRKRKDRNQQIHEDDISGSGAFKQDSTEVLIVVRESEKDVSGNDIYTNKGAILVRKTKAGGGQGQVQIEFSEGGASINDSFDLAEELFQ